ncbi:MAG: hypothetical protein V4659_05210 [Pseudomonadota bacterium]
MDLTDVAGTEPWLGALDDAVDARDRLRRACMVDRTGPQAQLARHDLSTAFDVIVEALATAR